MAEGAGGIGGLGMMILAYGAIWVILLVFVARAFSRLGGLQREIADLRREIDERLPATGADRP